MNSLKGFVVLWTLFFLLLGGFILLDVSGVGITGNAPLTGIVDSGEEQEFTSQEFSVSFLMEETKINRIRDVKFSLELIPVIDIKSSVVLTYVLTDSTGHVRYYDEETVVVQESTVLERDLDRRNSRDIELEEGDYVFSLIVSYGDKEETFSEGLELEKISDLLYSLKQLFDIKMEVDKTILNSADELEARIIFESFGSEPTPVDLVFFIYDGQNNEILKITREIVIETEGVMFESFEEFSDVKPGKYMLVLRTLYNVDIEDYFEQEITIKDNIDLLPFIVVGIIFLAGLAVFFILRRKK
ncbi:MAG: hypothetical protein PF542_02750 [Nanoarchaeota archaeon]|jgi:hypothetical protein|nr:hypothetical protein [Nanoarchaeota archaeon]